MNLGHSTNVHIGDAVYHVQTEDRGHDHPFIDTTVYASGRVLHRRTTSYYDVLNSGDDIQEILKQRVEDQHKGVIQELRSGTLKLAAPAAPARKASEPAREAAHPSAPAPEPSSSAPDGRPHDEGISVKLLNAASWASAGRANLQIEVRGRKSAQPQSGVKVHVALEGAQTPSQYEGQTNEAGLAEVQFALPKLGPDGGVLVIQASSGSANGQLRFQLKPRPRNPAPVS